MRESLPFLTRLWVAWLVYFKLLFDGSFASRVNALRQRPPELPPEGDKRQEPPPATRKGDPVSSLPPVAANPALQLLALLQREGRLVDFLQQDLSGFPDAEVGSVARVVHRGCRKALLEHVEVLPVRHELEGSKVVVEEDFSAAEIKLTGHVQGAAPYHGVLRHRGWRAENLKLPVALPGHDASVLAPAEVEL